MANYSLPDYVKSMRQRGYSIPAIRNLLLKNGYSANEIDDAINYSNSLTIKHEIHLSHSTIVVIVFMIVSLLGISSVFYFSQSTASSKLLDLNLEPVATTVQQGGNIIFIKQLSNLGSAKRYDVVIKQELIGATTNKVITQKIETRAIETFGSTQTNILVPQDTQPGNYILRATVEYDDKKAVATLPVKIITSSNKGTCFDGIKNSNEEGVDCGGVCKPCKQQTLDCNDNNPCTSDIIKNGACAHTPIVPCCGNNICEPNENCDADCKKIQPEQNSGLISTASLDGVKELAKTNPGKAMQECNQIEVPDLKDTCISNIGEVQNNKNYCNQIISIRIKDLCYSNIAKSSNDNTLCEEISIDSRKDSCYMTFVLDNKDYSVCSKLTNKHLSQSCESLRQLSELNQQALNQQQDNSTQ